MPTKSRFSLTISSTIQIASIVLVCVIYTFLLMQSTNMDDKSSILHRHYTAEVESLIRNNNPQTLDELHSALLQMEFISDLDSAFVLD